MLFVSSSGHGKRTRLDAFNRQGRGGQGVRGMKLTAARGQVVSAFTVAPSDEVLVFSSAGNIVRIAVDEISEQGRGATGVRLARLGEGDSVVAVARVLETVNGVEPEGGADVAAGAAGVIVTDEGDNTGAVDGDGDIETDGEES
jgi:DNA gyrase subunit A